MDGILNDVYNATKQNGVRSVGAEVEILYREWIKQGVNYIFSATWFRILVKSLLDSGLILAILVYQSINKLQSVTNETIHDSTILPAIDVIMVRPLMARVLFH